MEQNKKYCLNCGNECHEGSILYRTERRYASEGSEEYKIEVCRHCRCGELAVSYTHLRAHETS